MKTFVNSLFAFPLLMFMTLLFGEPASAGWLAIAVMWPVVLALMLLDDYFTRLLNSVYFDVTIDTTN